MNFQREFAGRHKLEMMLGYSYQYDQYNYVGGSAKNGPSDYVHYATQHGWPGTTDRGYYVEPMKDYQSDLTEKKMMSYFGRINYILDEKYMLTGTLRRDGSSVFGRDLRWATFPSVAVAWNFSEERFMKWFGALSFAKIRFSYGYRVINSSTLSGLWFIGRRTRILRGTAHHHSRPSGGVL